LRVVAQADQLSRRPTSLSAKATARPRIFSEGGSLALYEKVLTKRECSMAQPTSQRRVLVVEDDASIRELLRLHLDLAGFTIDEADEGRTALERARSTAFDLVLLDVMLPGLDGVQCLPGDPQRRWYRGRAVHIHFKVRTPGDKGGTDEFTSQLYFPDELTDRVHAGEPYAANRGQRLINTRDMIFREGGAQLILPAVEETSGYSATFRIAMRPGELRDRRRS
jgi:hypothetical protein